MGLQQSNIVMVVDKKLWELHCNYTVGQYGSGPTAIYLYINVVLVNIQCHLSNNNKNNTHMALRAMCK